VKPFGRQAPVVDDDGTCAHPPCDRRPLHPTTWAPVPAGVRRWWCPEHVHHAGDGDMTPTTPSISVHPVPQEAAR
jgi:hypothetical protein